MSNRYDTVWERIRVSKTLMFLGLIYVVVGFILFSMASAGSTAYSASLTVMVFGAFATFISLVALFKFKIEKVDRFVFLAELDEGNREYIAHWTYEGEYWEEYLTRLYQQRRFLLSAGAVITGVVFLGILLLVNVFAGESPNKGLYFGFVCLIFFPAVVFLLQAFALLQKQYTANFENAELYLTHQQVWSSFSGVTSWSSIETDLIHAEIIDEYPLAVLRLQLSILKNKGVREEQFIDLPIPKGLWGEAEGVLKQIEARLFTLAMRECLLFDIGHREEILREQQLADDPDPFVWLENLTEKERNDNVLKAGEMLTKSRRKIFYADAKRRGLLQE